MPIPIHVSCINKQDRGNLHERIKNIGGLNSSGKPWRLTQTEAIQNIENGTYSFYVSIGGYTTEVAIGGHDGNKYLTTDPDGTGNDSLLTLPECQELFATHREEKRESLVIGKDI